MCISPLRKRRLQLQMSAVNPLLHHTDEQKSKNATTNATNPIYFITCHSNSDSAPYTVEVALMIFTHNIFNMVMYSKWLIGKEVHF